ncbi:MAG: hypothetical protein MRY83_12865, partial [Flavobacteriales bacterium]|nr:hypothetical protein [Flavobacteriales bacterium]
MKLKALVIITLVNLQLFGAVENKDDFIAQFSKANSLYQSESFDSAITIYEDLASGNFKSNEVYFNLGNAYFKTNNIPYAILNYERYLKWFPKDEDAHFNLKIANTRITDKVEGKFDGSLV